MSRLFSVIVCLTAIGLSTPVRAQFAPTPTPVVTPPPFPPLTKTVLPEVPKNSPTGTETFVLEPAMSIDLDDSPSGPAGFDQRTAYIPLGSGRVVAVDLDQSTLRWSHDINTNLAPVVADGLVVVAGDEQLAAFDAATGTGRWTVPVAGGFSEPPLLDSGWVVVAAADGTILTIRAADGQVLWTKSLGAKAAARPFIAGDGVYFALEDGRIVKLALMTGEPEWEQKLAGRPGELLVLDDRMFVGSADKYFYCLNTKTGKERWRWRTGGRPVGRAAVDAKRVYYVAMDNILWALDRSSGVMKWRAELPVRASGGPIVIGTVVAVAAMSLEINGYRAQTGAAIGKAVLPAADLAGPPQVLPDAHPLVAAVAAITREGTFTLLKRQLEPMPLPMPFPFGEEIPLTVVASATQIAQ
jgi:outer membrane protein assembly factor BamB